MKPASQEESLTEGFAAQEPDEPSSASFITWSLPTNESRFAFMESYNLSELTEIMRQRQMYDLDGRNSGQTENLTFADQIWSDDELYGDEWVDFSEKLEEPDIWSDVFDDDLLAL